MEENAREQMLDVLFESETLEEGFIADAAKKMGNTITANVKAGLTSLKPTFTKQGAAKKAAQVANIKQSAIDKNANIDAQAAAKKNAAKFQKDSIAAIKKSNGQAKKTFGALNKKMAVPKVADQAFTVAANATSKADIKSVESLVNGICTAFINASIYASGDDSAAKDAKKDAKAAAKDAKKQNVNDVKNASKTLKDAGLEKTNAEAPTNQTNADLEESTKWEAYKLFHIKEANGFGGLAQQLSVSLLSNFIAYRDLLAKNPAVAEATKPYVVQSLVNSAKMLIGKDGKVNTNFMDVLNKATTEGNGKGNAVFKNIAPLYKLLQDIATKGEQGLLSKVFPASAATPEQQAAATEAPKTQDPKVDAALQNAIKGLSPEQQAAFAQAAQSLVSAQ